MVLNLYVHYINRLTTINLKKEEISTLIDVIAARPKKVCINIHPCLTIVATRFIVAARKKFIIPKGRVCE
jgi:hypothetical protein